MQQALAFLPETGTIDILIEESMPWFMGWCFAITVMMLAFGICEGVMRLVRRSPVDKLLRRRSGRLRQGFGEGT